MPQSFIFSEDQQHIMHEIRCALTLEKGTCLSVMPENRLLHPFSTRQKAHNVYLYGPVGRGKTSIIEAVYNDYPQTKTKMHFDHLCADAHHHLETMDIAHYVTSSFSGVHLLWVDELQIYDITTAMLLKRLIPEFIKQKITLVLTGNIEPIYFYKKGLNRELFEGFIPYFYEHFICLGLYGEQDYRRLSLQNVDGQQHFWQTSPDSLKGIEQAFLQMSPAELPSGYDLDLNMRYWRLDRTLCNAAFISFHDLAEEYKYASDYECLVRRFPNIFLTHVPVFDASNRDACRRFMAFIDILYDQKCALWMEADAPFADLYQDPAVLLPFDRTTSRLIELLSV
jgi:cell division protein ZapE